MISKNLQKPLNFPPNDLSFTVAIIYMCVAIHFLKDASSSEHSNSPFAFEYNSMVAVSL